MDELERLRNMCSRCHKENAAYGRYDRYGIYAGRWCDDCWNRHGYDDFEFDESYAGESLDEDV